MYSTCLHCIAPLRHNDVLESFPVGRRLAFDPARGRLWVVCTHCGRWNLAPLGERWEAIEQCERLYRATYQRYGTDHIGLAGLPDGTELVRIGAALRPEVAAWRYGVRLLRRHPPRGAALLRVATTVLGAGVQATHWFGGPPDDVPGEEQALRLTLGLVGPGRRGERVIDVVRGEAFAEPASPDPPTPSASRNTVAGRSSAANARPGTDVSRAVVRRRHLATAVLLRPEPGEPWQLEIAHEHGPLQLRGAVGLRTARKLLSAVNRDVGSAELVADAVRKVDEALQPDGYFRRVLRCAWRWRWGRVGADAVGPAGSEPEGRQSVAEAGEGLVDDLAVQLTGRAFWGRGGIGTAERLPLLGLSPVDRLALEMAAHEDAERAALAEELAALEAAWRDAEEIAAIADSL